MAKYKDFLASFQAKIPKFLQSNTHKIAEDIVHEIHKGIAKDGIEIRGHFSITKKQKTERKSIIFRSFQKNITNTTQ